MRTNKDLIVCATEGCAHTFFYVVERGERAAYCFDCSDVVFGRRAEQWT